MQHNIQRIEDWYLPYLTIFFCLHNFFDIFGYLFLVSSRLVLKWSQRERQNDTMRELR